MNQIFKKLAASDEFKVKGYFRFRKVGKGRKTKKLVWINASPKRKQLE